MSVFNMLLSFMYNKILKKILLIQNAKSIILKLNRKQWLTYDCIRILISEENEITKLAPQKR